MDTSIITLHRWCLIKWKVLNCTIFQGNPFTPAMLVSLDLVHLPSVSLRARANTKCAWALLLMFV